MDGSIDIRLIVTLAGMLVSVAGAAAVAKMQLKIINDQLKDIESRLRTMDKRIDRNDNQTDLADQRIKILADMNSVPERDKLSRAVEKTEVLMPLLSQRIDKLEQMHNGQHPQVQEK